jgi:amino acid transporter
MAMTQGQQAAATMKVGISNYVAASALGVIGGATALYTYVSQNFDVPGSFDVLMFLALAALVLSIVLGGSGSDTVANQVAQESWAGQSLQRFNLQAILTLLGLILVVLATIIGVNADPKKDEGDARLGRLSQTVGELHRSTEAQATAQQRLEQSVTRLRDQLSKESSGP